MMSVLWWAVRLHDCQQARGLGYICIAAEYQSREMKIPHGHRESTMPHTHTHTHTRARAHAHTHIVDSAHARTHAHTCTHTHTHTHTHTLTQCESQSDCILKWCEYHAL